MKRPVTLLLVATLLASTAAFAASNDGTVGKKIAREVVRNDNGNRGNDGRNDNNRGNDRRNDNRGNGPRNDNNRGNSNHAPPSHDRRDDRRNDGRNDGRRDGNHDRNDHRRDWNNNRNDRNNFNGNRGWDRPRNDWHNHPNYWDNRRHDRRDYARYRYHYGYYRPPAGYYHRVWHRGDRLPVAYYGRSYIVYDWRPYRLYSPPYGYHWVRVGNDVLLTAIATGVVLDVLYDIWY